MKMQWIDVKNEIPKHNQFVLAVNSRGFMAVFRCDVSYDYCFMWLDLTFQVTDVTHWMPLPTAPACP